jgi:hypothetical protein
MPQPYRPGSSLVASLSTNTSERRLACVARWGINEIFTDPHQARVSVPCRPNVKVLRMELASRLLMAALLQCRDLGWVELRLIEPSPARWQWLRGKAYVQVTLVDGPLIGGLLGRILSELKYRRGEAGAGRLLSGVMGNAGTRRGKLGGGWVIAKVQDELAALGYMHQTVERNRLRLRKVQAVMDCDQIQTLAEDCELAVDRWTRAWVADLSFSQTLLAECMKSIEPPTSGG